MLDEVVTATPSVDRPSTRTDSREPIIRAVGVTKIYRQRDIEVRALHNLTLDVQRGEIIAIMGNSGSGKTTLMNCLSGIDNIDSGRVYIAGQQIDKLSDNALTSFRASQMGFIFQSYNLLPVLSARENVEMALILNGIPQGRAKKVAQQKLELVEIGDRAGHKPSELSGGQQQRVTIARALANNPSIVWADEPTGNLDSANEKSVMDLIVRLNREQQQTFVMVTHSETVASIAHRTIHMHDGEIVES